MKKIRWIIPCLIFMVIISLMFGCRPKTDKNSAPEESPTPGESPAPEGSPSPTATGESIGEAPDVTVDIFQFKSEFKDAFEEAADQFMQANRNVIINLVTVRGGKDYGDELRARFNSGEEPAVFNIGGPQDLSDWKGKLADVSDTEAAKNVLEGLLAGVTEDGRIYGLPYYIEGYGLIYNKQIFEKAQIDPKSVNSFKGLQKAAEELDKKKKELGIDAVFAFPAFETWVTGLHLSNIFLAPEFDNDVLKTFQSKTVEFKYSDAFKQMVDLQNKYSVQPTSDLDYKSQVEKLFSAGKVAMIQQGNWAYSVIEAINKDLAQKNIGIFPYPVLGFKEEANPVGVPMYWAFNNGKPQDVQKAAKDFISWLYLSEAGKKIVAEQFKIIPPYKGFASDAVTDPISKELLAQASAGKTINWVFTGYPANWGMDKLGADIRLYVQNKLSWDQLIKNAKDSWAEARK